MQMPTELKNLTEKAAEKYQLNVLRAVSRSITESYMANKGTDTQTTETDVFGAVYSVVRMPATYGAVYSALQHTVECFEMGDSYSLLDVGAGTGAGSAAASTLLDISSFTCIEREPEMRRYGEKYLEACPAASGKTEWKSYDLRSGIKDRADILLSSYVLNEMTEQDRIKTVKDMWEHTNKLLLIVEPGTPQAFSQLRRIREELLREGAHIAAPCVHEGGCPLFGEDWCHFTVRVQRSKLHRLIKEAAVPYEDEKFSYIAFAREKTGHIGSRILRHPQIGKGNIGLTLCSPDGCESIVVTKKDKIAFKEARKSECGDLFICNKDQKLRRINNG